MSEQRDLRDGISDADDTGLVAGEELITRAETLLPLLPAALPHGDLHASLPQEHGAHADIDSLHHEVSSDMPDRSAIERHVSTLREVPELEAVVANWWDDPKTQRFIANLGQIGL